MSEPKKYACTHTNTHTHTCMHAGTHKHTQKQVNEWGKKMTATFIKDMK